MYTTILKDLLNYYLLFLYYYQIYTTFLDNFIQISDYLYAIILILA